ncbi:hypothetical protein Afer_0975 [Acidimicrobium ferrooxidans DSM 10331]|uniref:Uncharacterized protein n=1 Tax=Acidimicrobium ferrooxidans (strain DSM 10331 / JCM 15462 / NBRC 103882 / ICP) TaxID=525909 RepID=C7LYV6_ACIFD|nr:hypothetical protein Afer_0975 [Acidimicrobium ferrooxidans DSM 10331]
MPLLDQRATTAPTLNRSSNAITLQVNTKSPAVFTW